MARLDFPECFDKLHKAANIEDIVLSKFPAEVFLFREGSIFFPNQNYGREDCLVYGRKLHRGKRFPKNR